ncbi:5-methyltetrahydropteroyltriglutamate--homocysteine methyltransferase [Vibrio azureus]|uniref:Neutral metalloproteinase n=1 Tax=Vibrio azureus NBRC 104587 TaxID=1219077 RepID=U3ANM8_9VIBR|nr:M4 family metallopeptidase [Vibrio azureus]AUI86403.1 5-methyltetrahydropteroyltriglutamate--homocysteine methyltransferase [Vibrio azureus]GAD75380.1 putative zinc metallopeptidase [Vibrio azureus NBRC 104587]
MKKIAMLTGALFGITYLISTKSFSATVVDLDQINIPSGEISLLRNLLALEQSSDLVLTLTQELPDGSKKQKFSQEYNNANVKSANVTIKVDPKNPRRFIEAHGLVIRGLARDLATDRPMIDSATMKDLVATRRNLSQTQRNTLKIQKYIELDANQKASYVYQLNYIEINGKKVKRPFIIVDAKTGEFIREWDGMHQAKVPALGNGIGGNEKTQAYRYGTQYDHLNITKENNRCYLDNDQVMTIDMRYSWDLEEEYPAYSYLCYDETNTNDRRFVNGAYSALNDAHYFGNVIYRLYQDWVNTAPLTFKLKMRVHFGFEYENAFWDGEAMTFGDGENEFYPLVDINVSTHEVSHGFTEQNSNLEYSKQSGGINEAFSDIAGEAAEYYMKGSVDWIVGADITKGEGGLRYFDQPEKDGHSIAHFRDYNDDINVHLSSGIFNKAFYLLVTQNQWNIKDAFHAFALANQLYWHEQSTFDHAACGVKRAAKDLNLDQRDVVDAFYAVGVNAICSLPAEITKLELGVPVEGLSGRKNEDYYYSVYVPAGSSKLTIDLQHSDHQSSNDADLYVSLGEKPTSTEAQCQSRGDGRLEQCRFTAPEPGLYLILVRGYFDFNNYRLVANVE